MLWGCGRSFRASGLMNDVGNVFLTAQSFRRLQALPLGSHMAQRSRSNCLGFNPSSATYHQLSGFDMPLASPLGSLICKMETMRVSTL